MKSILFCDDNVSYLANISILGEIYADKLSIKITTSLGDLLKAAVSGEKFDAIFLDGHLGDNQDTLPFLIELRSGRFPHLKDAVLYFISSDPRMQTHQQYLVESTAWKHFSCQKHEVIAEIRKMIGA